jgi:hypothetical protein
MKIYPDSKLPLKPESLSERYLLYTFESRERWLAVQAVLCLLVLGIWALSRSWVFGFLAGLNFIQLYLGFEARAIGRMIRRSVAAAPSMLRA